jgi:hypothetical protein
MRAPEAAEDGQPLSVARCQLELGAGDSLVPDRLQPGSKHPVRACVANWGTRPPGGVSPALFVTRVRPLRLIVCGLACLLRTDRSSAVTVRETTGLSARGS